jgi:hypothetical protein
MMAGHPAPEADVVSPRTARRTQAKPHVPKLTG